MALVEAGELISGLLGAVVGGVSAYVASVRLERTKASELTARLHCLLIPEIYGHQVYLALTVDKLLPSWLMRDIPQVWPGNAILDHEFRELSTAHFDQFFGELVYSPKIVQLANYYNEIKAFNRQSAHLRASTSGDRDDYVRQCAFNLIAAIDAVDDLLTTRGIGPYLASPLLVNRIKDFREYRARYRYQATLVKHPRRRLQAWSEELFAGRMPADLPAPFREDRGRLMAQYLDDAENA